MSLEKIENKVVGYFNLELRNKSRVEEYVNARVIFSQIALDNGYTTSQIAKHLGVHRTLICHYRSKQYDKYYKDLKDRVLERVSILDDINDVSLQMRLNAIVGGLRQLDMEDMEELNTKIDLMIKAKQWKNEDRCKKYICDGISLND